MQAQTNMRNESTLSNKNSYVKFTPTSQVVACKHERFYNQEFIFFSYQKPASLTSNLSYIFVKIGTQFGAIKDQSMNYYFSKNALWASIEFSSVNTTN